MRLAVVVSLLVFCLLAADARAIVPPKSCGRLEVGRRTFTVKVDQISCRSGRAYTHRYLARKSKPRGYRCRNYRPRRGRVQFSCSKGRRVFFAIRR